VIILARVGHREVSKKSNSHRLKTKLGDPVLLRTWPPSTTFKF
jgi:hypothetical protein